MLGETISHYRIVSKVGEGGMASVYKAEDTTLNCFRALKFLHSDLDHEHSRLRFLREAQAAAALNHPSICTIHEICELDGHSFIAMEFIDGQTLRERLASGAMSLTETLQILVDVTEAIQEAHEKGIVHRDIKPSNIMIDSRGRAKVTDFGLAILPDVTHLTRSGQQMGTVPYMSPEQTRGEPVDHRTDVWSLGVVFYEMIAGRRAFDGDGVMPILRAIQTKEPATLSKDLPPQVPLMVKQALAKNPHRRYQSAAALLHDLRSVLRILESTEGRTDDDWEFTLPGRKILIGVTCVSILIAVGLLLWRGLDRRPQSIPTSRPVQVTTAQACESHPSLSPDGSRLAYVSDAGGNLDIFVVNALGGQPVRLTNHPAVDTEPVWLTDGSGLLFVSDRGGQHDIWRIGQFGGDLSLVLSNARTPAVSPDGEWFAFCMPSREGRLRIGRARLDSPQNAETLTGEDDGHWDHTSPTWSPDGDYVCYGAWHELWLISTSGGPACRLLTKEAADLDPAWAPNGRHIYFSSHRDGTLALWRVDRQGKNPTRLTWGTGPESHASISEDGARLAYSTSRNDYDIVIRDVSSGQEFELAGLHNDDMPSLAPDQTSIVFVSNRREGHRQLWRQFLEDGRPVGELQLIVEQNGSSSQPTISPDGRWVAYYQIDDGQRDVWVVPIDGGRPERVIEDPGSDIQPTWSPTGGELAFVSDRGGRFELWSVPMELGRRAGEPRRLFEAQVQVTQPCWLPDGSAIAFVGYLDGENDVWIVATGADAEPRRITTGANPSWLRFAEADERLWLSADWGEGVVRVCSLGTLDGGVDEAELICLDEIHNLDPMFDISRDGQLIVYSRINRVGDIWVLEAQDGVF